MVAEVSPRDAVPRGGVEPRRAVRTLPIRVKPLPEESLDSWLEALAGRTDATWGEILHAVGIFGRQGNTASYWADTGQRVADTGAGGHHQLLHGRRTVPASGDDSATLDQRHQLATSVCGLTARDWFAVLSEVS